jgi:hypothetical protein
MLAKPAHRTWVNTVMSKAKELQELLDRLRGRAPDTKPTDKASAAVVTFSGPEAARALDALMILDAMVAHGDITNAEDGSELFSFPLSALMGDILGAWRAESEDDEDAELVEEDGLLEDCGRTLPVPEPAWRAETEGEPGGGSRQADPDDRSPLPLRSSPLGFVPAGYRHRPSLVA